MISGVEKIFQDLQATHNVTFVQCYSEVRVPTDTKVFYMCCGIGQKHFFGKVFLQKIKPFKNIVVFLNGDLSSYAAY